MKKRFTVLLLALTCLVSLSAPALSAGAGEAESVHAELFIYGIRYRESQSLSFYDDGGYSVDPLVCNGTTYIPLRTAAMWLAADPVWDRESMTVTLTANGKEPDFYSRARRPDDREWWEQYDRDLRDGVTAELRRDLTVTVDGQTETFVNVRGEPVYPLVFRDNVYLPVRDVARLCDLDVLWYQIPRENYNVNEIVLFPFMLETYVAEARSYLDQIDSLDSRIQARMEELTAIEDLDFKKLKALLEDIRRLVSRMRDLPIPGDGNPLAFEMDSVSRDCNEILRGPLALDMIDYRTTSNPSNWSAEEIRDYFLDRLTNHRGWLHESLEVCELAYASLAAQEASRAQ